MQSTSQYDERLVTTGEAVSARAVAPPAHAMPRPLTEAQVRPLGPFGWPIPSLLSADPEAGRACILLPGFDALLLEKARVISGRYPQAEAQCRGSWGSPSSAAQREVPHFERVFQIASEMASVPNVQAAPDYDALLILGAWYCVQPGVEGYLGSYPKSLLCPLSHLAPPSALATLSPREQAIFQRRAPVYLRYLLGDKFRLRTCADIENADLRHLLRSTGFRLIRSSAVAEIAFPGITRGDDPPVRPWKLTLRQELTDERAAELLLEAALWQIKYGLRLVSLEDGSPRWNIGAFGRTDWEDAFLSLGVRVPPSLLRQSGLLDWRALLRRCLDEIGRGNLPPEVQGRVSAEPQRICHDNHQAIWEGLDRIARTVMERVKVEEPQLFLPNGELDYETARTFRGWARLFDEVSPQVLSRFGVSAFTALRRVAPQHFGWGCTQLKPWELEQEYGKWKGPRGRALLRSAYAYALFESGLGSICPQDDQVLWQCTLPEFSRWYADCTADGQITPYNFLYRLASRHGLTPLLTREVSHTAAISLLAGINLHEQLPQIEGCWEMCVRMALEHHGGRLEVRLVLPDLVPLPLRLRKAVLAPLAYGYLQKELRLVRDFDLRMAREARCKLEELPGWWEDERILGTPLAECLSQASDPVRTVLGVLCPDPWLEPPAQKVRFRALHLLLSKRAANRTGPGEGGLSSDEMRVLLRLAFEATLEHTNIVQVSLPAIRRGFKRLLARDDTREMLDSLLLHVATAYETQIWGQVRKLVVLDVINDLVSLTVRSCLLHLMSADEG
ncbi:hypothetical protein SBV1_60020 [Verrucomicrobia bacterium]|nr:hypothetical protein SBV1_60020 [Verrucomicrobiota bacterium]